MSIIIALYRLLPTIHEYLINNVNSLDDSMTVTANCDHYNSYNSIYSSSVTSDTASRHTNAGHYSLPNVSGQETCSKGRDNRRGDFKKEEES